MAGGGVGTGMTGAMEAMAETGTTAARGMSSHGVMTPFVDLIVVFDVRCGMCDMACAVHGYCTGCVGRTHYQLWWAVM